mgnify:CR=1 FL=1
MVLGINAFLNEDRDYAAIGSMMALLGGVLGGGIAGAPRSGPQESGQEQDPPADLGQ